MKTIREATAGTEISALERSLPHTTQLLSSSITGGGAKPTHSHADLHDRKKGATRNLKPVFHSAEENEA